MAYYEGQISDIGCGGNGGMGFGGNGWGDLAALIVVAGLFGWGNGGFGGGFGGGRGGVGENYVLATDFATIERKLDGVNNGLCDGFYAVNTGMLNGFASVQQTLCQGFNGIERSLAQNGYQTQAGFNALGAQLAQCCCDVRTELMQNRYLNEKQTCEIVGAINAGNQRLVDIYTADKLASKDARIAALEAQISNAEQSAYLLNELKPCPKASYIVQPPQQVTFPTNCCGNVAYAGYGACGASVQ